MFEAGALTVGSHSGPQPWPIIKSNLVSRYVCGVGTLILRLSIGLKLVILACKLAPGEVHVIGAIILAHVPRLE